MSGVCIDKLPHECGTTKGLQVFADSDTGDVNGFCFSCSTFVPNPYGEPKKIDDVSLPPSKTEEEIQEEITDILSYRAFDLKERKLREEDLSFFGIKVSVSEHDGKTPTAVYFPVTKGGHLSGYYVRTLGDNKYQFSVGDVKKGEPIGWEQAKRSGAYKLIITEGAFDMVAIRGIFRRYGSEQYQPAVISLPNGVNSVNSSLGPLAHQIKHQFKEIVLAFDMDEKGQEAVRKATSLLPGAKVAILPEKDANDCVLKGASKAAFTALNFSAATAKNTKIITASHELHVRARTPQPYGKLTWPFPLANKMFRNLHTGKTMYIGAGVKMGKSVLIDTLTGHFVKEDKVRVTLIQPEAGSPEEQYKRIAGQVVGKVFHDPDVGFDYDAYDKAEEILSGKLDLIEAYQYLNWEALKEDIIMSARMGSKVVVLDPLTNLTAGMDSGEANSFLSGLARDMSALAKEEDIAFIITSHLKAPDGSISQDMRAKAYSHEKYTGLGNCPHERGGSIYSNQFTGSRAMMQACDLMLGLEGNKDPELPSHITSMRWLTVLEDRMFGNTGAIPLYFNSNTESYKEA